MRAVVAIGGMSDTTIEFLEVPMETIKAAVEAAAALGLPPAKPAAPPPRAPTPARPRTRRATRA